MQAIVPASAGVQTGLSASRPLTEASDTDAHSSLLLTPAFSPVRRHAM